jgi:hypothetical protein
MLHWIPFVPLLKKVMMLSLSMQKIVVVIKFFIFIILLG